jgi:succinoglycan biosynthesis transport protein ExoP
VLGINCVSALPALEIGNRRSENGDRIASQDKRIVIHDNDILNYVIHFPLSQFTEALRSLKLEVDLNRKSNTVIGITSTLPNEGKSTIASNFAHLIAHAGNRVILVDCDLRKASLSGLFAPSAGGGLVQLIAGEIQLADAVWTELSSGMTFVPAGSSPKLLHTGEILASDATKSLMDRLRNTYDYVILDLPPLAPIIDARASSSFIDSYFYVVEWGKTNRNLVERLLAETPEVHERLVGGILNRVDMNKMARYEGDANSHKYRKLYGGYGLNNF